MSVASLINQTASASFLETMTSSARHTIQTNLTLFISYVSNDPLRMIDEMCLRNLFQHRCAEKLKNACSYSGDVGVRLIDLIVNMGKATCEKFIKYLCQVDITKDPAQSELHQLESRDVPADADFQRAVLRHKIDLVPIISPRAAYFIEALAQHGVLGEYNKKVLDRAVNGIEFRGASEVVDTIMFSGEQHCKSFLEMVRNPEFLARYPADDKLLSVLQAYRDYRPFVEMVRNPEFLARFPADDKLLSVLQAYRPED